MNGRSTPERTRQRRPWTWLLLAGAAILLVVVLVQLRAQRAHAAVLRADPERALADPALRRTAVAGGASVYARACAACHGAAGKGDPRLGVPDLTDDEHLYGEGKVAEIEAIARYGIRAGDTRGWNLASMPAYATARPYKAEPIAPLTPAQVEDQVQFLLAFTGRATDPAAVARGRQAFAGDAGCWDCHGRDAGGDAAIGAPALSDDTWLYGRDHDSLRRSIAGGRAGYSPSFARALTPAELREVAVYVAALAPPVKAAR